MGYFFCDGIHAQGGNSYGVFIRLLCDFVRSQDIDGIMYQLQTILYAFDEQTDEAFTETIEDIKGFKYSRYTPLLYLKDKKKYASLLAGQHNMGGFMKGVLVKRLESSFYAFRKTLGRFIESYEKFISMYNKTGEEYLLKLGDIIASQTADWKGRLTDGRTLSQIYSLHCVNLAQGFKEPVIRYQATGDKSYLDAIDKGREDLMRFLGMPNGMYGADEMLHSADPTQGSEFCSAVELMFSLEKWLRSREGRIGPTGWKESLSMPFRRRRMMISCRSNTISR